MKENIKQNNNEETEEENLRLLIDHTYDPIWYVNRDLKIVACNHAFKNWVTHFIGLPLGKGDDILYEGKNAMYRQKFEMCYKQALGGVEFKCIEDMMVNELPRYTSVNFNPVYNDKREIIGVSCFAIDVTEQRKHLLRIEEQNKVLTEIAAIQSHKVRGPVATILGLGQFFNYDDLSDPVNKVLMEGIISVSEDLDVIIKEVVRKSNKAGF